MPQTTSDPTPRTLLHLHSILSGQSMTLRSGCFRFRVFCWCRICWIRAGELWENGEQRPSAPQFRKLTLPTHWALSLGRVLLDPFQDAMLESFSPAPNHSIGNSRVTHHMEVVSTFARYCWRYGQHAYYKIIQLYSRKLQSSPGYLHEGQVPSKCT